MKLNYWLPNRKKYQASIIAAWRNKPCPACMMLDLDTMLGYAVKFVQDRRSGFFFEVTVSSTGPTFTLADSTKFQDGLDEYVKFVGDDVVAYHKEIELEYILIITQPNTILPADLFAAIQRANTKVRYEILQQKNNSIEKHMQDQKRKNE